MNHEIAKRWVAALRDPKAKQTTRMLGDSSGARCCLGVLCDLAVAEGIIPEPRVQMYEGIGILEYGDPINGGSQTLPAAVRKWAGIESANGTIHHSEEVDAAVCLSEQNDKGTSFLHIAKLIEEYEDLL